MFPRRPLKTALPQLMLFNLKHSANVKYQHISRVYLLLLILPAFSYIKAHNFLRLSYCFVSSCRSFCMLTIISPIIRLVTVAQRSSDSSSLLNCLIFKFSSHFQIILARLPHCCHQLLRGYRDFLGVGRRRIYLSQMFRASWQHLRRIATLPLWNQKSRSPKCSTCLSSQSQAAHSSNRKRSA